MDDELLELQRQFEFAQQAKSSIRLSDRNVVELVQKLQELRIIDFDLLHTVSGKEYITPEQLKHEILTEIKKSGRVSLIDLADIIGVDLYHVEKQSHHIVSEDPDLMLIQGEIISQSYWDSVAEEINDRLQECSQIALAELAAQLHVGSELVASVLEPRLGTLVKGRLEGGQLYTPAYVARVSAMVRGASRGITVPINLSILWSSLQQLLQEMDGSTGVAVDSSFFQSLFNGLVKEGEILGSLRAGVHWTPTVFAVAQKESIDSFFSQNSFINYEVLQNLGIPQPVQFLKSRYPEGTALVSIFVHPSLIEMLDTATEDAIAHGSWIDALSVLPASFGSQDASKLLSLCPSVQLALKSNKAVIFGESYLFSDGLIKDVYDLLEKEMEILSVSESSGVGLSVDLTDTKVGHDSSKFADLDKTGNEMGSSKHGTDRGSKKKRGKSSGTVTASVAETGTNTQESSTSKSKKNQRKGKDTSSSQASDPKAAVKKESVKTKEDIDNMPSEEWIIQKITLLVPDFEEQGIDDPETIIRPLANYLRPKLVNFWKQRRKALFTENAVKMKNLLDNLQKKLDESFLNMQLYEKALDLFEDDQSTSVILHRHLLRTTAAAIADTLIHNLDMHNKIKNGVEVEPQTSDSVSLSPGERTAMAKSFPGSLSNMALATAEALEGKQVETFMTALRAIAEESGLILRKLDKKLERTLLHSYRKDLTSQVSAESDPVSLLPKVVSLLYIQLYHKALQAPGRAISVAITRLKDKLAESAYKILTDYQAATVTLLSLISAATGDEEDCTSDRILTKRELLESQMPALKDPFAYSLRAKSHSFRMENIWTMGTLVFLLAAIPQSFQDYSYDETWVTIDCGATNISWDEITGMAWETDDRYIKSGENKLLSTSTNRTELKTLRSFPGGLKNCYDLPLQKQSKYLLRAGFLYGNYDNLQKPPTFGLLVQGDMNVTVATSLSDDPVYHEFIFTTRKKGHVYVCLIQTQANQVPFISSLEATIVDEKAYRLMTKDTALYLQSRINYGANLTDPDHFAHHVDPYSRIWTPEQVPGYLNIDHGLGPMIWEVVENFPPNVVLDSAIVGTNASKSIFLPINFRERYQVSAYFVLYFDVSNVHQFVEETTTLDIFIDGQLVNVTQLPNTPRNEGQAVVSICPVNVTGGMANLTISPAEGITSPAFLNGLEVYSLMGISKAAQSTDLFAFQTLFGLVLFFLCVVL